MLIASVNQMKKETTSQLYSDVNVNASIANVVKFCF